VNARIASRAMRMTGQRMMLRHLNDRWSQVFHDKKAPRSLARPSFFNVGFTSVRVVAGQERWRKLGSGTVVVSATLALAAWTAVATIAARTTVTTVVP